MQHINDGWVVGVDVCEDALDPENHDEVPSYLHETQCVLCQVNILCGEAEVSECPPLRYEKTRGMVWQMATKFRDQEAMEKPLARGFFASMCRHIELRRLFISLLQGLVFSLPSIPVPGVNTEVPLASWSKHAIHPVVTSN